MPAYIPQSGKKEVIATKGVSLMSFISFSLSKLTETVIHTKRDHDDDSNCVPKQPRASSMREPCEGIHGGGQQAGQPCHANAPATMPPTHCKMPCVHA